MKIKLTILNFEDKIAANKARFTRFSTSKEDLGNKGWVSCWDKKVCDTLKDLIDKDVVVETKTTGDFVNIIGICPDGEQDEENGFDDAVRRTNEQEETLKAEDSVKPGKSFNGNTAMYTSYAKDIFIAQYERGCNVDLIMLECIQLVKKAKEAFS